MYNEKTIGVNTCDELYHYGVLGMKWGVRRAQQKIDKYRKKRLVKRERKAKLNKAYSDFQKDLYILEKSGRGNDIDAVIKRSAQYDAEVRSIKDTYKAEVGRKYIKERFGV